jgi:hypothetical protein
LLLVTAGIRYVSGGSNINVVLNILFEGENISFDASLVMYIVIVSSATRVATRVAGT